ncbi:MAG TPA: hypothetical protein VF519_04335 [Mycobacteriales bacterium]|jgi:hypothetical protein
MDADALLHPRGPLPPSVYWRRRLVTLGVAFVLLALLFTTCGGDGKPGVVTPSTSPSAAASPTGQPTGRPAASATATAALAPCPDSGVVVSARADAQTYPASRRPILTIGVANKGAVPCTRDVGQAAREIIVRSGNDRVWSSDDCSPGGGSQVVTLQPGAAPVTFSVTWSRKRSAAGCPAGAEAAGPGTYRVTGRFGQVVSTGDTFTLTG